MASNPCENNLYELFVKLSINTGKLKENEINAWFSTDCKASKEFLNWLTTFLSSENVVSSQDQTIYESLVNSGTVLSDEAVKEFEKSYPGVFNVDDFDVECLKDEVDILEEDLHAVQSVITFKEDVQNDLQNQLSALKEEQMVSNLKKIQSEERCLQLSEQLEDTNNKLGEQIKEYCNKLSGFHSVPNPRFITNAPFDRHMTYVNNIQSTLLNMCKVENVPNIEVTLNNQPNNSVVTYKSKWDETLDTLQNRIIESSTKAVIFKSQNAAFDAGLNYLKQLDVGEISGKTLQGNELYQLEAKLIFQRERLMNIESVIEEAIKDGTHKLINSYKLIKIREEIKQYTNKLKYLSELDDKMENIIKYLRLLKLMLNIENENIRDTDKVFLDVFHYTEYDLSKYATRTNLMLKVIDDTEKYLSQQFVEKWLISNIFSILSDQDQSDHSINDAIKAVDLFQSKYNNLEQKVFIDDFNNFKMDVRNLCKNLNGMMELLSGTTKYSLEIIPYRSYSILNDTNNFLLNLDKTLETLKFQFATAKGKTKGKWVSMQRKLWMNFLVKPKKVLECIEYIKDEVNKTRNKTIN